MVFKFMHMSFDAVLTHLKELNIIANCRHPSTLVYQYINKI